MRHRLHCWPAQSVQMPQPAAADTFESGFGSLASAHFAASAWACSHRACAYLLCSSSRPVNGLAHDTGQAATVAGCCSSRAAALGCAGQIGVTAAALPAHASSTANRDLRNIPFIARRVIAHPVVRGVATHVLSGAPRAAAGHGTPQPHHRRAGRHPAAVASFTEQKKRSPFWVETRVRA